MIKQKIIYLSLTLSIILLSSINASFSQNQQNADISVKLGIDILVEQELGLIENKNIALFTNQSGVNFQGIPTAEILSNEPNVNLIKILVPEHGYYTTIPAGEPVENDSIFNVPITSLYGPLKIPNRRILEGIDAVVVDIQDIGVRSYTYISSLLYLMQGCANNNVEVIVLDRPNPLGGLVVDGNTPEKEFRSFVSLVPVSYIHGCTIGELALMINSEKWTENKNQCNLSVIKMQGWERWMSWEDTKLMWIPTSPHVPTSNSVRGIATVGTLGELGLLSVGIGTTSPFGYLGSPYINLDSITTEYEGLRLQSTLYRPFYGMYNGKDVNGFFLKFNLSNELKPYSTGLVLLNEIVKKNPELLDTNSLKSNSRSMFYKVTGTDKILKAIESKLPNELILSLANDGLIEFLKLRDKYLIY
jgi:uncharacterized protein YbbC (DUF1343 family)